MTMATMPWRLATLRQRRKSQRFVPGVWIPCALHEEVVRMGSRMRLPHTGGNLILNAPRTTTGSVRDYVEVPSFGGVTVRDVWFVLLTLAIFLLLGLAAKGAERL
jgi:hypothetical protein